MSAPFQYFTLRRALFCITYLLSYLSHIYSYILYATWCIVHLNIM